MFRILTFTSLLFAGAHAAAFDIAFDKALKIELARCEAVLPIRQITEFAVMSGLGFMSEQQIKDATDAGTAARFVELAKVVTPYLDALDERGEVMDLTGKDELTIGCAKYAKGVLITPYQKLFAEMLTNALRHKK